MMAEKGNHFYSLEVICIVPLYCCVSFCPLEANKAATTVGSANVNWKPVQFDFWRRFNHKSMTNYPWRLLKSSPSFHPCYRAYCILYGQRNMKLLYCLLFPSPPLMSMHIKMCGHKGNRAMESPFALQSVPAPHFHNQMWQQQRKLSHPSLIKKKWKWFSACLL